MESSSKSSVIVSNQRKAFEGIRMENPFSFKVAQIFTGFGFGCGVGIGVGRPVNLGIILYKTLTHSVYIPIVYRSIAI